MPERSFGRTVRFRRTKLGLSQAKLGELVGRSPSTVRSWERDRSMPTETAVLHALSAVLGVDERTLFEKAGQEAPSDQEISPTLEQALASLASPSDREEKRDEEDQRGEAMSVEQRSDEVDLTEDEPVSTQLELTVDEPKTPKPAEAHTAVPTATPPAKPDPGYVKPPEPYVVTPTTPRFVEPSYVEDAGQRQLYRVRNLATLVVAVAMVVALIWALSETLGALGSWWDGFFGSLRL